jgi:CRP-like cAMP-binding protein
VRERRPTARPRTATGELGRVERELIVRAGILAQGSTNQVAQLVDQARPGAYGPGEILYMQGAPARQFFVIADGEVELDGPAPQRYGRGAAVGILDVALDRSHARTAIAVSPVRTLALDARDYFEFLEDHPDLTLAFIAQLALDLHAQHMALPHPERVLGPPRAALLPAGVRPDTLVERLPIIRHLRPFLRASVQAQVNLADDARDRVLVAGDVLFRAGEPADVVWMVARGTLALEPPDQPPPERLAKGTAPVPAVTVDADAMASNGGSHVDALAALRPGAARVHRLLSGPGDLVAHTASLAPGPRRFTATALSDTVVLGIDREALHDRMEEHFDLVRSILAFLAGEQDRIGHARALQAPPAGESSAVARG